MGYTPADSATIFIAQDLPATLDLGIDFLFFGRGQNSSASLSRLKGIKLIPKGIHLVHFTDILTNTRNARFLDFKDGDLVVINFDKENNNELLVECIVDQNGNLLADGSQIDQDGVKSMDHSRYLTALPDDYPYMINFMQYKDEGEIKYTQWVKLLDTLNLEVVSKIIGSPSERLADKITSLISTDDSTKYEVEQLEAIIQGSKADEKLKEKFSPSHIGKLKHLEFTAIDFKKTIRPAANIEQITKDYLDKTWIVLNRYGKTNTELIASVLPELRLSFLLGFTLNNYSCFQAWGLILKLLLNCSDLFLDPSYNTFLSKFVETLKLQLSCLSVNLVIDKDNDEVIFKLSSLALDFKTFLRTINENGDLKIGLSTSSVVNLLNDKFGIQITSSLSSDDDNEDDYF